MRTSITTGLLGAALVLTACAPREPQASASMSASPAVAPSTSASNAVAPSMSVGSVEPVPSDTLSELSCELPVVEGATVALANITDVRIGTHPGYDRVVFEFADGLPEMSLDRASPPFTHDASGMPIDVAGSSFLRLTLRGGTKQTADHSSSYDGPTDFSPGLPALVQLVEGGDFEAQSTWYFGLTSDACVRVIRLTDDGPARLVIDIES